MANLRGLPSRDAVTQQSKLRDPGIFGPPPPVPVPDFPSDPSGPFPSIPQSHPFRLPGMPPPPFRLPGIPLPDPTDGPLPIPSKNPLPPVKVRDRKEFLELFETLSQGSILFPGCKAYEQAIFIGNLLYRFVTPSAVVQAVVVEDVMETVKFARRKNIPITIKSGGHSMGGYCLNDGGIVLDISSMNEVKLENMTYPTEHVQIAKDSTVTMQGGAVWNDAYSKLKAFHKQLVVIGGNCPSVGVSAYLLGGGVSPFSRKYGLGIDSLVEMIIVTAEGEKVTVTNDEKDQKKRDLFWAVRGGGGGNFGITVGVKVKMHYTVDPEGTVVSGNLIWNLGVPKEKKNFKAMMDVWNKTTWPEEVRGDALWHYDDKHQLLGQMTMVYNGDREHCNKALKPLLDFKPSGNDLNEMHWTDWEVIDGKIDVFEKIYHHHASFIFGQGGITPEVTNIITDELMKHKVIVENEDVDCYILWHHIGGKTTEVEAQDTAFFWRKGVYVFHIKVLWKTCAYETISELFDTCKRRLAPYSLQGKAAYLNYIDPTVKDWPQVYYGDNYPKLRRVKTVWDKDGFFRFPQGLRPYGSDQGEEPEESWKSWSQYALPTPELLGNPKTTDEIYSNGASIRRSMIGMKSRQ